MKEIIAQTLEILKGAIAKGDRVEIPVDIAHELDVTLKELKHVMDRSHAPIEKCDKEGDITLVDEDPCLGCAHFHMVTKAVGCNGCCDVMEDYCPTAVATDGSTGCGYRFFYMVDCDHDEFEEVPYDQLLEEIEAIK